MLNISERVQFTDIMHAVYNLSARSACIRYHTKC